VPAKIEKVVVRADQIELKRLLPSCGDGALQRGAR
jgi:hypothetical protein